MTATAACLEQHGYDVFRVADGQAGIQRALSEPPDLILLDWHEAREALETCSRLKSYPGLERIPVIVVGALSTTADKLAAFDAGAVDCLPLPFQADELLARIALHIRLHRSQQELALENDELRRDRKSLEQRIVEHAEDLRLLTYALNQVHEAVYLIRADSSFAYVNDEACRALGYSRDELLGMGVVGLDPNIDAEIWAGHWADIQRDQSITMESHHQRRDGSFFPIEVMSNYFEYGGAAYSLGLVRDISERKQAERRLHESLELLQELSARRDHAREEEKTRIAREIHDELGQQLTALRLGLGTIGFQVEHKRPIVPERVRALLGMVDESIKTVRGIATDLRPAVLDSGLEVALQWLTLRSHEQTGIDCACEIDPPLSPLNSYQEIALFRIAQESLTNIARHAKANHAQVRLMCEDGKCRLEIQDDGCGFDANAAGRGSFGLIGMRERALMLNGDMHILSVPGQGTKVCVAIPCDRMAAA